MSKRTIFSLLFALLLGLGLKAWDVEHRDDCTAFLRGDHGAPATQAIDAGRREWAIPCGVWLPRQPRVVQVLCLVDMALFTVFVLGLFSDKARRDVMKRQGQRRF